MRHAILALAAVALAACADGTGSREVARAPVTVSGVLTPEQQALVAGMSVEVTGPGITTPVIADLAVNGATVNGTVTVPVGPSRTFTVRAYDAQGAETYTGSATASVVAGTNPPLAVRLLAREGSVPIDVSIGTHGVTLAPATASVAVGGEVTLTATVTSATGAPPATPPTWGVLNPALVTLTVAPDGRSAVVRGRIVGSTRVVVSYEGAAAASTVTIAEAPPPSGTLTAVYVAAGESHSCALDSVGNAFCWGRGSEGQLGDGRSTGSLWPVRVQLPTGVLFAELMLGARHSCARRASTSAWYCWGDNRWGQLGLGDTQGRAVPTALPAGRRIATVGAWHACSVDEGCWGRNTDGAIGGTEELVLFPRSQAPAANAVVQRVVAGNGFTCASSAAGSMGQPTTFSLTCRGAIPVTNPVPSTSSLPTLSGAGGSFACGNANGPRCWGNNADGQFGVGQVFASGNYPFSAGNPANYAPNFFGGAVSCQSSAASETRCAGSNSHGQLGIGSDAAGSALPVAISGGTFTYLGVGARHACGVRGGVVQCWGDNAEGQLGDGTTTLRRAPVAVLGAAP